MVITRFAPSPSATSNHIGGLRTALFNYLYAKKNDGKFYLRFEDTDKNRVFPEFIENTKKELSDFGIKIDNKPFCQSEKFAHYKELVGKLLKEGKAYKCYCTAEEIEARTKTNNGYDRYCRDKTPSNKSYVIRLKTPEKGTFSFDDKNFGKIVYEAKDLACDPVLLKSDGITPSYTLASCIDDHEMEVTHVLRGSEWLPSTLLSIFTYEAFGWKPPIFCHLPVINGSDGKKLSKRHGAVNLQNLIDEGYLPEAVLNYIVFLGWSPKNDRELYSLKELEQIFDITNINRSPAVFDYTKLKWFNKQYIQKLDYATTFWELISKNIPQEYGLNNSYLVKLLHQKVEKLSDVNSMIEFLIKLPEYDVSLFENKKQKADKENCLLCLLRALDLNYSEKTPEQIFELLKAASEEIEVGIKTMLWAIRIALSGQTSTFCSSTDMIFFLKGEEVKKRFGVAIRKLL